MFVQSLKKNDTKSIFTIGFLLQLLCLAAYSFNLFNEYNYVVLVWICVSLFFIKNFAIPECNEFIVLCITFGLYLITYIFNYTYTVEMYFKFLLAPLFCYVWGYNAMKTPSEKKFMIIIHVVIWAMFIHGMLTTVNHINSGSLERDPIDISSNQVIPATLHGFFFSLVCSLLFYLIFVDKRLIYRLLTLSAIAFSVYASLYHASRTLFVLIAIVFCSCLFYRLKMPGSYKSKAKLIIIILLIVVVAVCIYNADGFGLKTSIEESNMSKRVNQRDYKGFSEDGRIERSIIVLKNAFAYPLGGMANEVNRYAHNMWLDTIRTAGILPALFLIIYTIMIFKSFVRFIKLDWVSEKQKYIMLSIYICLYTNFFVEPVIEGYPIFFSLSCLFNGMVYSMTKRENT